MAGIVAIALALAAPAEAGLQRRAKVKRLDGAGARLQRPEAARASNKREDANDKSPRGIPAGQLHIVITLATQKVAVYSDGVLAARSNVATGVPGHPTPTGAFSVIGKERYHASNIYSGAPMPFMQRITWSGVALHQGVVPGGRPASHGCIRLTGDFAQLMWSTTKMGARVIIAQNEVAPSPFSHPALFAPKPKPVLTESEPRPVAATKTAEAAITVSDAAPIAAAQLDPLTDELDASETKKELAASNAPISVFVSAKEKRLFIRQAFLPIYEATVSIRDSGQPLGTHVFTAFAGEKDTDGLRWLVVSLPNSPRKDRAADKRAVREAKTPESEKPASTPAEALERLDIPAETRARIEEMVTAGASLIVSDHGRGPETGEGTDFVVLTR